MFRRPLRILVVGAVLAHAAPACVGGPDDADLNPQPLPPNGGDEKDRPTGTSGEPGSSSSGSSGSSGSTPDKNADAGVLDGEAGPDGDH